MMTMKRVLTTFLTALLLLGPATTAFAQDYVPTPVTISKDKVKIKGKTYYSHVVLERQTLYSIAQAYGVTVQEIYDANPGLSVLKKNAIILIPDTSARGYERPAEVLPPAPEENPEPPKEETKPENQNPDGFTRYIVKWNDTLYSIAEKFGVTVESIQAVNGLTDTKIKKRQELLIPTPEYVAQMAAQPAENTPAQTGILEMESTEPTVEATEPETVITDTTEEDPGYFGGYNNYIGMDVSFALVLPFKNGSKISENNVDFYAGVLLAVKDLAEKEGVKADVAVYDLDEVESSAKTIRDAQFILGPVSREALSKMLQTRPYGTPVVSPLDPKASSLIASAEGMIQVPTSADNQYQDLIHWLQDDYSVGERILLISEKDVASTDYATKITARLAHSGLPYKSFSYGILQGRNITNTLTEMLSKERANRILIASENEAFVNDVIRNLNVLAHKDFPIEVYAPAKFRNFETIEVEALHNVRLHVSGAYHIDYTSPAVQHFLMQYRAFYQTEPTPYAYQGYDIATYLVKAISQYGNSWTEYLLQHPETLTQIRFDFKRTTGGSLENTGTRRLIYDRDYIVKTVR